MIGEIFWFSRALLNALTGEKGSKRHGHSGHPVDTWLADIGKWLVNKFSSVRIDLIFRVRIVVDGTGKSDGG